MGKSFRDKVKVNHRGSQSRSYDFGGNRIEKGTEEDWEGGKNTILGGNGRDVKKIGCGGDISHNFLQRWLKSQVGRQWNDVRHDITLKTQNLSEYVLNNFRHVVDYMVEEKVQETPDGIQDAEGHDVDGLYVDTTGVLKFCLRKKYKRPENIDKSHVYISEKLELIREDGIWFQVEKRPVVENVYSITTSHGVIQLPEPITHTLYWENFKRKTLSTKELKRHGLENEIKDEVEKNPRFG